MNKLILLSSILSAFISPFTIAGDSTGTVSKIFVNKGNACCGNNIGAVMFSAGTHSNKPSCSVVGDEWAISLETEAGRAMYSLLLTAYTTGKTIRVYGTEACGGWSDREEPNVIEIVN